jgi:hypothetical protein
MKRFGRVELPLAYSTGLFVGAAAKSAVDWQTLVMQMKRSIHQT